MTMTFADYDNLEQQAMEEEMGQDFIFPSELEIPFLLSDREGVKKLMIAYNNTPQDDEHKQYRRTIMNALYSGVSLVETEEEVAAATASMETNSTKLDKIKGRVECMDFKANGFYPTQQELDTYISENTEENVAFLYWMVSVPDADLTKEQVRTKANANWRLNSWTKSKTKTKRRKGTKNG